MRMQLPNVTTAQVNKMCAQAGRLATELNPVNSTFLSSLTYALERVTEERNELRAKLEELTNAKV